MLFNRPQHKELILAFESPLDGPNIRGTSVHLEVVSSSTLDADGDGFVDGATYYQLVSGGSSVDLINRSGRTFSDSSSSRWDAIKAINTSSGFQILLAGTSPSDGTRNGNFGIWDVDASGVISSFSGWQSTAEALEAGWESLFGDVIQIDGLIGKPDNTTPVPSPAPAPTPAPTPEPSPVPSPSPTPTDDYSADANTTGELSIGESIEGTLETEGDHDWFGIDLMAGQNYQFDLSGNTLDDPYLYLRNESGSLLASDDDSGEAELDSKLTFRPNSSGRFYLDVGGYEDAETGTYTLSALELEAQQPGFSSTDGYGHVDAQGAFEELLGIKLPSASTLGGNMWGLDNINVPEVWAGGQGFSGTTGEGATIAVIDTGVDIDHPEFSGRLVGGYDFVDNDSNADDGEGHGTHVAGTIAGSNDGTGVTGIAPDAKIMPIRVLDDNGDGWTSDIIAGVRWAADNNADVLNLSLGGGGYSQALADAIRYASDKGAVVVMAAGNSGGNSPEYPAAHAINYGIAVGAVNQNLEFADFSNRAGSTTMDYVTAPGVRIFSSIPGGQYAFESGTSMATPHVAGIAGLFKSHDSSLSPETIEDLLTGTASNGSNGSSSSSQSDPITGQAQAQVITLENLDTFSDEQLQGRLIGSLNGNFQSRKTMVKSLRSEQRTGDSIDSIEVIESTRKNFVSLDLSDSNQLNHGELIGDWLSSEQFSYFEIDTRMVAI